MPAPPRKVAVSNKDIGERIKTLRLERGLTQVQLGQRLDMTQPNLSAIERGARGVTVHQIVRIAKALGASTDEILLAEKAPAPGQRAKRKLLQRLQLVQDLPKGDQKILLQILDGMVSHRQERQQQRGQRAAQSASA